MSITQSIEARRIILQEMESFHEALLQLSWDMEHDPAYQLATRYLIRQTRKLYIHHLIQQASKLYIHHEKELKNS